ARRHVHAAIYEAVMEQALEYIQKQHLEPGSVLLVAHSLGTVVGLDLLHSELGDYFGKYISLGSPLGMIAKVPEVGKRLLPVRLRTIGIEWKDVAAPNDLIAKVRLSRSYGFDGKPLEIVSISAHYEHPHRAYFLNETALAEWSWSLR